LKNSLRNRYVLKRDLVALRLRLSLLKQRRFMIGVNDTSNDPLDTYDENMRARVFKLYKFNAAVKRRLLSCVYKVYMGLLNKYVSTINWDEIENADDLNSKIYGDPKFLSAFKVVRNKVRVFIYFFFWGYYRHRLSIDKRLGELRAILKKKKKKSHKKEIIKAYIAS
jgi:hypothetical protein